MRPLQSLAEIDEYELRFQSSASNSTDGRSCPDATRGPWSSSVDERESINIVPKLT